MHLLTNPETKEPRLLFICPTASKLLCNWEGSAIDMLDHIICAHQDFLLDSNAFEVDVLQKSDKCCIIATDCGLFLVQHKVETDKLHLQLRFLSYDNSTVNNLRYSVEVFCDSVRFTTKKHMNENHNPVYNVQNGVEVDIKLMELVLGLEVRHILVKLSIYRNIKEFINCLSIKELKSELIVEANPVNSVETSNASNSRQESFDDTNDYTFCEQEEDDFVDCLSRRSSEIEKPLEAINQDFISEHSLQCANCKCNMIPPIHICRNQHNVCYACRTSSCNVCNEPITHFRNMYLEDYSKSLQHRCRYEPQGCTEVHSYNEIRKHELQCVFCIYKCELCSFEGKLAEIGTHFRIAHPSTKIYETMSGIHFRKGSNFIILNSLGVFYCTSSATDIYIKWEVIYCGPKERFFSCEVRVSGKKHNQAPKHYFLKRIDNIYKWTVPWDELKNANVKEKYAMLYILTY